MLALLGRGRSPAPNTLITVSGPPAREPSRLLGFLAGEFAGDVARLWPAPHTQFLTAPTERRHLACLALSLGQQGAAVARSLTGPFKRAIRALAPDAPSGLPRALGRLGETAWAADEYRLLIERLADRRTAKVLNHAEAIDPLAVKTLSTLPPPVQGAGAGRFALSESQAVLLAECFEALARRDGPEAAEAIARRWAVSRDAKALFRRVSADLAPAACAPPHPGTDLLVPLTTRKALADAGRRYRNCLAGRVLDGWNHYYEWLGEPGAVICVVDDYLFGWRLDEALAADNAPVAPAARRALEGELIRMGVHVGRTAWELRNLVDRANTAGFTLKPTTETVDELFGD